MSARDPNSRPRRSNRIRLAEALRQFIAEAVSRDAPDREFAEALSAVKDFTRELVGAPRRSRRVGPRTNREGEIVGFDYGRDRPDFSPVSGRANPVSPNLRMHLEGDVAIGTVSFRRSLEGSPGAAHPGHVAAVFDELFGLTLSSIEKPGMTGTLTVRFERPCPLDTELRLEARVRKASGRRIAAEATLRAGGELVADAEALFVTVDFERYEGFARARNR